MDYLTCRSHEQRTRQSRSQPEERRAKRGGERRVESSQRADEYLNHVLLGNTLGDAHDELELSLNGLKDGSGGARRGNVDDWSVGACGCLGFGDVVEHGQPQVLWSYHALLVCVGGIGVVGMCWCCGDIVIVSRCVWEWCHDCRGVILVLWCW